MAACRASTSCMPSTIRLKRLGTDYVDLYQIHRFDNHTPIEETIEALHDVVKAGKARYIGASSMYAWQFAKYLHTAEAMGMTNFVSMQNFYNLVYREEEREMLPLCRDARHRRDPLEPAGAGLSGPLRTPTRWTSNTTRAKSDNVLDMAFGDADVETLQPGGRDRAESTASPTPRSPSPGCWPRASPRPSWAPRR